MDVDWSFIFFSKNGKVQKRGKVNLIGRLQLSTEKTKQEENEGIVALRILRIQVNGLFLLISSSLSLIWAVGTHRQQDVCMMASFD
jgi:hypothetical protein